MFTIEQIKNAHAKVRSGADFPNYIRDIGELGVVSYETYVKDGHADYKGADEYAVSSDSKYNDLNIADESDIDQFKADLKAHQQGKTDYPTFCADCAKSGVEKWIVEIDALTCAYYDKKGNELLVEIIPL